MTTEEKPVVQDFGKNGNIFAIMGDACRALVDEGQADKAKQMQQRVYHAHSYEDALAIICEYVTPVPPGED